MQQQSHGFLNAIFYTVSLLFSLAPNAIGQGLIEKEFDFDPGTEINYRVLNVPDGYILAGSRNASGTNRRDIALTKISKSGELIWSKTYGLSNRSEQMFRGIIPIGNSGYLVAGNRNLGTQRGPYFVRIDNNGNMLWDKFFPISDTLNSVIVNSVVELPQGGYAISGHYNPGNDTLHMFLMRFDENFETLWFKTYDDGIGRALLVSPGGNLVVCGFEKFWKIRASDGHVTWTKKINIPITVPVDSQLIRLRDVVAVPNGYAVAGRMTYYTPPPQQDEISAFFISRFNFDGQHLWTKEYEYASLLNDGKAILGHSIAWLPNSEKFLLTGTVNEKIRILRINKNGNLEESFDVGDDNVIWPYLVKDGQQYAIGATKVLSDSTSNPIVYIFTNNNLTGLGCRTNGGPVQEELIEENRAIIDSDDAESGATVSNTPTSETTNTTAENRASPNLANLEEPASADIEIIPNPTNGQIKIIFHANQTANTPFLIVNEEGRPQEKSSLLVVPGRNEFDMDVSGLKGGHYFFHLPVLRLNPGQFIKI